MYIVYLIINDRRFPCNIYQIRPQNDPTDLRHDEVQEVKKPTDDPVYNCLKERFDFKVTDFLYTISIDKFFEITGSKLMMSNVDKVYFLR